MAVAVVAVLAAAQLGFQLTVTLLVYPALAATRDGDWATAHDRHSRRIVGPVAVLYGGLLLALPWAWLTSDGPARAWTGASSACFLLLLLVTALVAAPLHGRLGRDPAERRPALLRRLLRVDHTRLGLSVVLAICAAVALLTTT